MRTGSSELGALGGVGRHVPLPGRLFFILVQRSSAYPERADSLGSILVLLETSTPIGRWRSAVRGVILNAAFFVSYYERAFPGSGERDAIRTLQDLRPPEAVVA